MQDRLKCRIAVFERYKSEAWEFVKFIENNDKYGISTNGNVIQENVQSFIVHFPREKTPKHINITMEAIQCTGKKDKNGKLIYEGDIVKGSVGVYWGLMTIEYSSKNASFVYKRIDGKYYPLKMFEHGIGIEVIGNIYENPELLEEK